MATLYGASSGSAINLVSRGVACRRALSYVSSQRRRLPALSRSTVLRPRASAEVSVETANGAVAPEVRQEAVAPAEMQDVNGDMLKPSVANKSWVRALVLGVAVLAAARGTAFLPVRGAAFVHLLAYSAWLGSTIWVTFIGGITMFKNMPRQMFGKVQAKLFPQYFALHLASVVLCAGTLAFGGPGLAGARAGALAAAAASTAFNLWYLEPQATKVMFARYALENEAPRDEDKIKDLYKQFGKWHGASSVVNLVGMAAAVSHGWWLASALVL